MLLLRWQLAFVLMGETGDLAFKGKTLRKKKKKTQKIHPNQQISKCNRETQQENTCNRTPQKDHSSYMPEFKDIAIHRTPGEDSKC